MNFDYHQDIYVNFLLELSGQFNELGTLNYSFFFTQNTKIVDGLLSGGNRNRNTNISFNVFILDTLMYI
jgi:hypothetical protein